MRTEPGPVGSPLMEDRIQIGSLRLQDAGWIRG